MSQPSVPSPGTGRLRALAKSVGVKGVVLGLSALLGLLTTRLIVENFGVDAYAQYGLLVGLGALIPFGAFGMGAPVINAIGESADPRNDPHVREVLLTALRVLLGAALVLVAIAALVSAVGGWTWILGSGLSTNSMWVAGGVVALIGVGMPLGIGQRILTGLGKNHVSLAMGGLQAPLVLLSVAALVWLGSSAGGILGLFPYVALIVIGGLATWYGGRLLGPAWTWSRRNCLRLGIRGTKVMHQAIPMTVIMVALPLGMQTDRIVLSHVAPTSALATYNLAAQIFTPIGALVSAAGMALWPIFARARASGAKQSPFGMSGLFAGLAACAGTILILLTPFLAEVSTGGNVSVPLSVAIGFTLWMLVQAAQYPLGVYLTDSAGLRFQAYCVTAMVPVNIGLSWWWATTLGSVGPVLASGVCVLVFQFLANTIYVRRRITRMAASA